MHLEIKKDKDYTFSLSLIEYNIQSIPDSGVVTIKDNSGSSVSTGAVTVATDGTMSYTFLAADNNLQANNFSIEWALTTGTTVSYYNSLFDVVLMPLNNLVNDSDLFIHCKEMSEKAELVYSTTAEGTTTTLISNRFETSRIEWLGGSVRIYIDDSTTHDAKITAYNDVNNTITFSPEYTAVIPSGVSFKIRASYQSIIDEAFNNFVYRDIRNKLKRASGYLDDNVLRNLTIFKSLSIYAGGEYIEEGDKWWLRYNDYTKMYSQELELLKEPYDSNEDGSIDDREDDERPSFTSSSMVR